jgi:hypothetical protein
MMRIAALGVSQSESRVMVDGGGVEEMSEGEKTRATVLGTLIWLGDSWGGTTICNWENEVGRNPKGAYHSKGQRLKRHVQNVS